MTTRASNLDLPPEHVISGRRQPGEDFPDLSAVIRLCKVSVYKLGWPLVDSGGPLRTHAWHVLVPPEWPEVAGHRSRTDSGSGRAWYDGSGTSEEDARHRACQVLGLALGRYVESWMSGWTPEPVPISPVWRMGS